VNVPPPSALSRLERLRQGPGRFPGSLLLSGSSEHALDEASLLLAASLLCPGGERDRSCASCRRVLHGFHPDLFPVEPEGVQIRVDKVREAIAFAAGKPYENEYCFVLRYVDGRIVEGWEFVDTAHAYDNLVIYKVVQ